jgi:hypothetical protein
MAAMLLSSALAISIGVLVSGQAPPPMGRWSDEAPRHLPNLAFDPVVVVEGAPRAHSTAAVWSEYSPPTWADQQTEEQRLLYHLMRHYERAVRPVRNASHAIAVKLGLTLTNIFDMVSLCATLTWTVYVKNICDY